MVTLGELDNEKQLANKSAQNLKQLKRDGSRYRQNLRDAQRSEAFRQNVLTQEQRRAEIQQRQAERSQRNMNRRIGHVRDQMGYNARIGLPGARSYGDPTRKQNVIKNNIKRLTHTFDHVWDGVSKGPNINKLRMHDLSSKSRFNFNMAKVPSMKYNHKFKYNNLGNVKFKGFGGYGYKHKKTRRKKRRHN